MEAHGALIPSQVITSLAQEWDESKGAQPPSAKEKPEKWAPGQLRGAGFSGG